MKKIMLSCIIALMAILPDVIKGQTVIEGKTYQNKTYVSDGNLHYVLYGTKYKYLEVTNRIYTPYTAGHIIDVNYSSLGPELIIPDYLNDPDGILGEEGAVYPVTGIENEALKTAKNVVSIVIPTTMTSLSYIFAWWDDGYKLTSVIWNAKHLTNASDAFSGVRSQITSFTFGDEVEYIPRGLCRDCKNIETITLESNVAEIGEHAFEGCQSIYEIKCKATKTPNVYESTFEGISTLATLYVPKESIKKYQIHPVWSRFLDIQPLEESSEAVENTNQTNVVTNSKVLRDGRVVIVRDGETYSILGEKIK